MANTETRLPDMNIALQDPETELVVHAFIGDADALPDGATYADIFAVNALLQILDGTAVGTYINKGTAAVPDFSAVDTTA